MCQCSRHNSERIENINATPSIFENNTVVKKRSILANQWYLI